MGIQMKQKELTKTFMMLSIKKKKNFGFLVCIDIFQSFTPLTAGAAYIRVLILY